MLRGRPLRAGLTAAVCLLASALPAAAQKDAALALGVSAAVYRPADKAVENPWGAGIVLRLRRASGFGGTIGFNWFKADVNYDIGGEKTRVGTLLVRPLMVGVVYSRQYSQFAISGSFVVGRAYCGLRNTGAAADAFARHGQAGTTFDATDSFAYRPSFSVWWELGNKFGLLTSIAYISAHPEIVTTTPTAGTLRRTIDIGAPVFTVGIGYGIF